MTEFLTGDVKLNAALKSIGTKGAQKAAASGVRAGLGELRKAMRAATPNASAKKTIAARFKREKRQGRTTAKVGAGVGKHKAATTDRGRPGVGISKQNAHWYFMGVNRENRGTVPGVDAIRIGAAAGQSAAMAKTRSGMWKQLEKEAAKLPK